MWKGIWVILKIFAATILILFLAGCRSQSQLTPQQAAGQHLYQERCAHCHEENDLALKPPPPSLSNLFRRSTLPSGASATDAQIIRTVLGGKNKMPSFAGRFTQEQMDALVAYLHTGIQ
jgi:mono/diheme cytochrome c family protein